VPPSQPPKSCDQICAERGKTTQPQDHTSFIRSSLEQYSCVSGAQIRVPGTLTVTGAGIECKCYSTDKPEITVVQTPPVCQTPCGPVQCGSSAQCACPDAPNCVLTASCGWKGWRWEGLRAIPVVGTESQSSSQGT
jgi:hypothetical protein